MTFRFSRQGLTPAQRRLERCFEILPGATSWSILIGMVALALWRPVAAAVLIVSFQLFWLFRIVYLTLFLVLAYVRLALEQRTDWMTRSRGLDTLAPTLRLLHERRALLPLRRRLSERIHRRDLERLAASGCYGPASSEVHQLIIVPIARETREILEPGIKSLMHGSFPSSRMLLVLAVEARADESVHQAVRGLQQTYREGFLDLLVTVHPEGLPGEARVKGANATFAAKAAADTLKARGIPFDQVIVSCFDADTVVSAEYFACLTYSFLVCPERLRASFQPIPVYHNNIWEAPGFARVLEMGSSFFQMIEATNPVTLVTFSSHSMSFQALVEVDYWPVDLISDDSAIFWKAFIHYQGDYRVIPMYVTLSMDVVNAGSWRRTVANVYKQKRRWAWGVENFPIVMRGFLASSKLSLYSKLRYGFKLFEGHVSWATWAFLLTAISWLPVLFGRREFSDSVLYWSAPRITGTIFNLASLSLIVMIILSWSLLPRKHGPHPLLKRLGLALEWLLVPVSALFLSALPALDAQTRLMLGKYMEFWVTEKQRTGKA